MGLSAVLKKFAVVASLEFDDKAFKKFDEAVESTKKTAEGLALSVTAAAASVLGFTKITANNARDLHENSTQLGINVERMQELEYAAKVTASASREELVGALQAVSSTLDNVRKGNIGAASGYERLGLAQDLINDRTLRADQVLARVADRLRQVRDPVQKTAIATELFGSAGAKLIPLLDQGSDGIARLGGEGRRMGAVLSESMIQKGVQFDRLWKQIQTTLENITYTIGTELFGAISPVIREFQKWILENRKFLASNIAIVVKSLGIYLFLVVKGMTFLAQRGIAVIKMLGGLEFVMKGLAIVMAVFFGAKILFAIGAMTTGILAMAAAITAMNISALLIPIAIGAAVLLLIGIFEDLFTFFRGGDSLFGRLTGLDPAPIVAYFKQIGSAISDFFVHPLSAAWELIKLVAGGAATLGEALGGALKTGIGNIASGVAGFLGMGPSSAPAAGASTTSNTANKIDAPITITVPHGTTAAEATKIASDGAAGGLEHALRQTKNMNRGGVAR